MKKLTYQELYDLPHDKLINEPQYEQWVGNGIIYCASYLVEEVLSLNVNLYDDIENLYHCIDEDGEIIDCDGDCLHETECAEIFEWWIVDKYLFEKLRARGEPVLEYCNLYFWGRCTTGQAICLDYCMSEIYREGIKETFLK